MAPVEASLVERYRAVRDRVRAAARATGRPEPTLIAVSKTHPVEAIVALHAEGHRDFGENYVQELVAKHQSLAERGITDVRWHFLGHLQTNKAKALAAVAPVVHSIDSVRVAEELGKRWRAAGREGALPLFLEVNVDREPTKGGVDPEDAPAIARQVAGIAGVELRGLMAIPAPGGGRVPFARLREIEAACRPATRGELSMGMTQDFEDAVAEGATHVRVGTAIFGPRG